VTVWDQLITKTPLVLERKLNPAPFHTYLLSIMSKSPRLALAIITAASLAQVACAELPEADEQVAEAHLAATISNELTPNGLSNNGLSNNGLSNNGLSNNGLSNNGLAMQQLENPAARELLTYLVSCALPEGEHFDLEVDGVTYGFDGSLGLAPEWGGDDGYCDKACREWVSACVLSRVNYLGEHVMISVRGKHPALIPTCEEFTNYTHREAAYYGDIFSEPKKLYACVAPGNNHLIPRVCGPDIDNCVAEVADDCDEVCGPDFWDGSYSKCRDPNGKKHKRVVTVFLNDD
jgi:hypothetical protein